MLLLDVIQALELTSATGGGKGGMSSTADPLLVRSGAPGGSGGGASYCGSNLGCWKCRNL
jgi:hypothetical protein